MLLPRNCSHDVLPLLARFQKLPRQNKKITDGKQFLPGLAQANLYSLPNFTALISSASETVHAVVKSISPTGSSFSAPVPTVKLPMHCACWTAPINLSYTGSKMP